jgi:uncharacterized repeat protein (TIGR03803 family)
MKSPRPFAGLACGREIRIVLGVTVVTFAGAACTLYGSVAPTVRSPSRLPARSAAHMPPQGSLSTLHSFLNIPDGALPLGGVVIDDATGNIFGTTFNGGRTGHGTAFVLEPEGSAYTESIIRNFAHTIYGGYPQATPTLAGPGELYVIETGSEPGDGSVIMLKQVGSGSEYETIRRFQFDGADGEQAVEPFYKLGGKLYTTTAFGGTNAGTITVMTPSLVVTSVYEFKGPPDATEPFSDLITDSSGALYGTSLYGGSAYDGAVFKFVPTARGGTESVAFSFPGGVGGQLPEGGLLADRNDNLYGVTFSGGSAGFGVIYRLEPTKHGYREHVLHQFGGAPDGSEPHAALTKFGDFFYGTTVSGGTGPCVLYGPGCGTIFRLSADGSNYQTVYNFQGPDGASPTAARMLAHDGALYGTTEYGGSADKGTVFRFNPSVIR